MGDPSDSGKITCLHESETLYQSFFDCSPDAVFIHDLDGRFLDVNEEALNRLGYDRHSFIRMNRIDIEAPECVRQVIPHITDLQFRGNACDETVHLTRQGERIPSEINSRLITFSGYPAVMTVSRDISARKSKEKSLLIQNQKLEAQVRVLNCLYAVSRTIDERTASVGEKLQRIVALIPSAFEEPETICARIHAQNKRYETHNFRETARKLTAPIRVHPLRVGRVEVYDLTAPSGTDDTPFSMTEHQFINTITEQVGKVVALAQMAVSGEKERERLISAIDQALEGLLILDAGGKIEYVNPAFERLTGYGGADVKGLTLAILDPQDPAAAFYSDLWQAISSGEIWSHRIPVERNGGERVIADITISPVRDNTGVIGSYVGTYRDVTQEMKLEERIRHGQKMEAIGSIAGGIAHDFNNILTGILGYTELSMAIAETGSPVYRNLVRLLDAGKRGKVLADQILAFSRQFGHQDHSIRLDVFLEQTIKMIQASSSHSKLIKKIHSRATVLTDPTQLHSILTRLILQVTQLVDEMGGETEIVLEDVSITEGSSDAPGDMAAGRYVRLTLAESEETFFRNPPLPRFMSSEKTGPGFGVDLSYARPFFQKLGGIVQWCEPISQRICIHVWMPRYKSDLEPEDTAAWEAVTDGALILFVDDETYITDLVKQMIESIGYPVWTTTDPKLALAEFSRRPRDFGLVITDQAMPEMPGHVLASAVRRIRPDIPLIICSGFSEDMVREHAKAAGVQEFLMKPVLRNDMAAAIRRAMGR